MTYDQTGAYRSAQVTTSSAVEQVVLLYEGAIRFSAQSVQRLAAGDLEGAHVASLRAQAIVSALRESLDMAAGGEIAAQLDGIYDFLLRRLVAGNVAKQPEPAREAIELLRALLVAWRAIASPAPAQPTAPARPMPMRLPAAAGLGIGSLVGAIRA